MPEVNPGVPWILVIRGNDGYSLLDLADPVNPPPPGHSTALWFRDADMVPATIPVTNAPITPADVEMGGTPGPIIAGEAPEEGSENGEEADLFGGGGDDEDEESNADEAMEEVQTTSTPSSGVKRKLVEEEDYD